MLSPASTTSISWTVMGSIKDKAAFEVIKEKLINSTEKEEGTLQYEWCINADKSDFMVIERYRDLVAAEIHNKTFGTTFATEFLAACEIKGVIYVGELSETLESTFKSMGASFYTLDGGMNRLF